jgi:hypothetical protein
MASTDCLPVPRKNVAYRAIFPIYDNTGALVTGAAGLDSEVSKDQGTFTDCTNEATEIATSSGIYYLDLTSTEMNADGVSVIVKTSTTNAKTTVLVFYPQESGDIKVDLQSIAGSTVSTSSAQLGVNVVSYASGQAPLQPTVAGRTLDVSAGGEGGVDWANVGSPTTAVDLSGTTIKTTQKVDVDTIKTNPVVNGGTITFPTNATVASTTGAVGSVTGAVGSVTGAVGSVTGAVGSVTGNVGGNVVGSVGSVTGAVGSVTGNVGGNVVGSVASVTAAVATTSNVKKNQALSNFQFLMTDSTNHAPATGKTVTVTRGIDNGSQASGTLSAVTEISNGLYRVDFGAGDLNGNVITLRATASGCDDTFERIVTQP